MTSELEEAESRGEFVCFVIGPIGDKHSDPGTEDRQRYEDAILTLENVIVPACKEVGLDSPIRSDAYSVAGEIPEQVFRLLHDADVVIADVTGGNPNVMYELGLRHSRNKLTLQVGEKGKLPFDISSIRTIQFRRTEGGYIDAKNELRAMLEAGLVGRFDPVTATRVWLEDELARTPEESEKAPAGDRQRAELAEAPEETEPGFLEVLAQAEEAFPKMNQALQEMTVITQEFGALAEQGTREMEESESRGEGAKGRLLAAIRFAERLDDPLKRFERLASGYRAEVEVIRPAMDFLLDQVEQRQYEDLEVQAISEGLSAFKTLGETTKEALVGISGFRDSLAPIANAARPVRSRVRPLEKAINIVIETSTEFVTLGKRASELLDDLNLGKTDSSPE